MVLLVNGKPRHIDVPGAIKEMEIWSNLDIVIKLEQLADICEGIMLGYVTATTMEDVNELRDLCEAIRFESYWRRFKLSCGIHMEVR